MSRESWVCASSGSVFELFRPLVLAAVLLAEPVSAQIQCTITQVTDSTGPAIAAMAAIDAVGNRIAFHGTIDPFGTNADGNFEIFLYDRGNSTLTQLTDTPQPASNLFPDLSADGTLVAWSGTGDPTGGNPDASVEVFLRSVDLPGVTQVTSAATGFSSSPTLSDDNAFIAFHGTAELVGPNTDGLREIYVAPLSTLTLTRVTDSAQNSREATFARDSQSLLFDSESNPVGTNADLEWELFSYDLGGAGITQITDSSGQSGNGGLDFGFLSPAGNKQKTTADGNLLAFHSTGDLDGGNPGGALVVYTYDRLADTFQLLTPAGGAPAFTTSIDAIGGRVAYISVGNPTGENADGSAEVFLHDLATNQIKQVTDGPFVSVDDGSFQASLNAHGTVLAFNSNVDLTGDNADGNFELFVAVCPGPVFSDGFESGDTSAWSATVGN